MKATEQIKFHGADMQVNLKGTRIKTLDQLVKAYDIDLTKWKAVAFKANKWEFGGAAPATSVRLTGKNGREYVAWERKKDEFVIEPLYQVSATFAPLVLTPAAALAEAELKRIQTRAAKLGPFVKPFKRTATPDTGLMLELAAPDAHFGKLAWAPETGWDHYDTRIAERLFEQAHENMIARTAGFGRDGRFDEIWLPIGNDLMNSDNREYQTSGGTIVTTDGRYEKVFGIIVECVERVIMRVRPLAKRIRVIIVRGNHDYLSSYHLGHSLQMLFRGTEDIVVDNDPSARKYYQWGGVMLGFGHGNKPKRAADFAALMAVERPDIWGKTFWREMHTGDKHHREKISPRADYREAGGATVRILPSLCAADDWHAEMGFVGNVRCAEAYVWSKTEGLLGTATYAVPDVKERRLVAA